MHPGFIHDDQLKMKQPDDLVMSGRGASNAAGFEIMTSGIGMIKRTA